MRKRKYRRYNDLNATLVKTIGEYSIYQSAGNPNQYDLVKHGYFIAWRLRHKKYINYKAWIRKWEESARQEIDELMEQVKQTEFDIIEIRKRLS